MAYAVRGFFQNGGLICYVVRVDDQSHPVDALQQGLESLALLESIDLLCVPDIMHYTAHIEEMQKAVLDHCSALGDRFAILDVPSNANDLSSVITQRNRLGSQNDGALYYPWLQVEDMAPSTALPSIPPCGHIAGVYARSDQQVGVFKAPANERIEGAVALKPPLSREQESALYKGGVNCLHPFAKGGIRVWGARTLSQENVWQQINVRRLLLTIGRWIRAFMAHIAFEPNTRRLWMRIVREITFYLEGLFQRGAFKGATPEQAFYVKCDGETNPPEVYEAGMLVTEIGVAPAIPSEFVVVRIVRDDRGVTITS